jgi:hypothetical protein
MDQSAKAVVISRWDTALISWMHEFMHKHPFYMKDDFSDKLESRGEIVHMKSCETMDGHHLLAFDDKRNHQMLLDNFPEIIVDADPFGPDVCPKCAELIRYKDDTPLEKFMRKNPGSCLLILLAATILVARFGRDVTDFLSNAF